ncbi:TPA: hypothetical protein HMT14_03465 [Escherichia coli]|nr:hypothetical protein [Escherichia coli]
MKRLSLILLSAFCTITHAAPEDITFTGTLIEPPVCTVSNGDDIEIQFIDVIIDNIDGVNYRKDVPYQITCDPDITDDAWVMTLTWTGTQTNYNDAAIQTDVTGLSMNKLKKYQCIRVQTFLLGGVLVLASHSALAANNLHFYGNLMSKTCTPVEQAGTLAEVQFANISHKDLMVRGQSDRVPVVFRLKDCRGPAQYSVKVTLTGTEDSGQPGFLALDDTSGAQGVGIGMETTDGTAVAINNTTGVTFVLNDGNNSLNFRAWLQAKEGRDVTPGNFTAQLTATFEYI